jgi:hypothetical protein
MGIPSRELKHQIFVAVVVDGGQTAKLVVDIEKLPADHGIPPAVLSKFPSGVPLDINPRFPLNMEVDETGITVDLAFGAGGVCTCYVTWDSVAVFAIGLGGVRWEYEALDDPPAVYPATPEDSDGDSACNTVIDMFSRRKPK